MLLVPGLLAQAMPVAAIQEVVQPQEVRPLPGQLDQFPVFNSNSPELIQSEGILLSTLPGAGKRSPRAHLNFPFTGRFDVFAHHVARAKSKQDKRPVYVGILFHNSGKKPVRLMVMQGTSILSNTEAPFIDLPAQVQNRWGQVASGPGSRATNNALRRQGQGDWPTRLEIPPGQNRVLVNLPISASPTSSRTTWLRLYSSAPVHAASLALFARRQPNGTLRPPNLQEWESLLASGSLVTPRDQTPTPPGTKVETFFYGRVAGVSQGGQWQANITDRPGTQTLTIPQTGQAFSYVISSLDHGTLGTNQIQSAPMLTRYPDTAYRAHGNYGLRYNLQFPLFNGTPEPRTVTLALQTPIKENRLSRKGLRFLASPTGPVFFRGTVRLNYQDEGGTLQQKYFHLVQRRGQQGNPLVTLNLPPAQQRSVQLELLYPPDSTPPQVITVRTVK